MVNKSPCYVTQLGVGGSKNATECHTVGVGFKNIEKVKNISKIIDR